jgi:hypothetical protein
MGPSDRRKMRFSDILAAFAMLFWVVAPLSARAQAGQTAPAPAATASPSEDEHPETGGFDPAQLTPEQREALQLAIVKISQNPVGNITVFPFQNNINYGYGPYARLQYNLNVQPVFPIMLSPNWSLVARTIIPVLNQPSSAPPTVCASPFGCPSTFGLSDVQEQLFFGPKTNPGQVIWAAGPIFQFPSATPNTLGSAKWAAGPNVVVLVMPGKWVIGALTSQLWSFAGPSDRAPVSSFLLQPFINYNLKEGWALSTAPVMTANWTATQNKWAVPVGGGIAKTFKDGGQLMQISVQYYTWVTRPLANPQTDLKITWSLLWPVKRGIDIQKLLQESK